MNLAPIVLFCYNRPRHVEETLYALSKNIYADESYLFIFCDGPKANASPKQLQSVIDTRTIVRKEQWCKNVTIFESDDNKGLANSIISGVNEIIDKYGKAIILEDDLVTSRYFLKFMNEALDFYKSYPAVFSISGYNYSKAKMQIPIDYHYDTYVSLRAMSWGWATWKEKWKLIDFSMSQFHEFYGNNRMTTAFNRCGDDVTEMLCKQWGKTIDSWAIRFGFSHFSNHAVAILPITSFVKNIGLDGSGTHCFAVKDNNVEELNTNDSYHFLSILYEDADLINSFYNVHCRAKRPLWQKSINYLLRKIGRKPFYTIKKQIYSSLTK